MTFSGIEEFREWQQLLGPACTCYLDEYSNQARLQADCPYHGEEMREPKPRPQVGGSHYQLPIEPIDFIVKNDIPFREGNAIKYIVRHRSKNGAEDIRKAIHYLTMILEDYES